MTQTTLATIPRLIAQVLSIYDIAPEAIFSQAGINLQEISASDDRIAMEKMAKLWQLSVEATGNKELGLVAASLFQPTYLKGIGLAWMASANLEEGLRRFVENSKLVNTFVQIELIENDDELLVQYQPKLNVEGQVKSHQCAIQLGVGFLLKMFRLAAAKTIPATGVYFKYALDEASPAYQEYFQCPIYGEQPFNGIAFSKKLLNELLPTHDAELVELNEMAINRYIKTLETGDTSTKVMKMVSELLPTGCPTEETIAYKLHMSKRTLQRKLQGESTSFLSLLNSVRLLLAKEQLTMTSIAVTEISYQLGYSSPSTFARAFKKLTDQSPLEYRASYSV